VESENNREETMPILDTKYQKYNALISILFIAFIILFSIFINQPLIILFILPIIILITLFEQKAGYCPKKYSKYLYLTNIIAIFASISFWILTVALNIQVIIFNIFLFIMLQILLKKEYFVKENILIVQHIIAVSTFFVLAYSFFPTITFDYINFTADPIIITFSNIILHSVFILSILLLSFYYLYAVYFYKNPWKNFRRILNLNFILIIFISYGLISYKQYFTKSFEIFSRNSITLLILFPIVFMIFIFINFVIRVFSSRESKVYSYYSFWFLIFSIFFSIITNFYSNGILVLLDLLFLSIFSYINLKFGLKIGKVRERTLTTFTKVNSYFIFLEFFGLLFFLYFNLFSKFPFINNLIISAYLSLVLFTLFSTIFLIDRLISKSLVNLLKEISLVSTAILIFYVLYTYTIDTYYTIVIPVLFSSLFFYLPILYIKKKIRLPKLFKNLMILNSLILSFSLLLIPTIISLELIKFGRIIDIFSVINGTLFILYGILGFLYLLVKNFIIKIKNLKIILKIQTLIGFIVAGTVLFYYPFKFFFGSFYALLLPSMAASGFLFIPLFFSYTKEYFNPKLIRRILIVNSFFIWSCIILIPSLFAMEFTKLGFSVDVLIIVIITSLFVLGFLKFLGFISDYSKMREPFVIKLKLFQIINWFTVCLLVYWKLISYVLSSANFWFKIFIIGGASLIFFILNLFNLYQIEDLKQRVFEYRKSKFDFYKIYKIYEYNKNLSIIGIVISLSTILFALIQPINFLPLLFPPYFNGIILICNVGMFLLIFLALLIVFNSAIRVEFEKFIENLELLLWLGIKTIMIFVFVIYPFKISILNHILLTTLIFACLSPITLYFSKQRFIVLEFSQESLIKFTGLIFFVSIIILFIEFYWNFMLNQPLFDENQFFLILLLASIIFLLINSYIIRFNEISGISSEFKVYPFFLFTIILLGAFFYLISGFFIFLLLIIYILILYRRNRNIIIRSICYCSLGYVVYINSILLIKDLFIFFPFWLDVSLIIGIMISILFASILLNLKRNNNTEKFSLYTLVSIQSFLSILILYPAFPVFYNFTISLLIFLALVGNFFYNKGDEKYKWFIRPSILLFIFDLISYLSYAIFFNNPLFIEFNLILSFNLTITITGLAFVSLYNKSPPVFRKRVFYIVLTLITISFPIFIYFLIIAAFSLSVWEPIIFIVSLNIGILLYYLSIGIYQWKISWAIWKAGWRIWIFFPIVNFLIIYESLTGLDIYTNALSLFGIIEINGSFLITLVISILLSLPFWYTWIKKNFALVLFLVWGLSLFLIYWFSQNLFVDNLLLTNILFSVFAILLLMPILYKMKFWKILTLLWIISSVINVSFLFILLADIQIPFEFNFSLVLFATGFHFIIISFFPNLKAQKGVILIASYFVSISGIYLIIFNLIYRIILNIPISINFAFILIGLSLFSSRIFKLNQKIINFLISIILTSNFSLLTFFTFILIPENLVIATFLAITVFGGGFYVFNRFKMITPIKKIIPIAFLSIGTSFSLFFLIYNVFPNFIFIALTLLTAINIAFIYSIVKEYRFIIWYFYPIPIAFLCLQFFSIFSLFQPIIILILLGVFMYTAIFQILLNVFNPATEKSDESEDKELRTFFSDKNQIKILNLICFILNSTYLSLLIALLSRFSILLRIFEFLIIWSILILLSLRYIKSSGVVIDIKNLKSKVNKINSIIGITLYFEIFYVTYGLMAESISFDFIESILISCCILFVLTLFDVYIVKRVNKRLIVPIHLIIFVVLQISIVIYSFNILLIFNFLNIFSLLLIIIIETILIFYPIYSIRNKYSEIININVFNKLISILIFIVYIELTLLFYGLFNLYFGIYESFLGSQIILCFISLLEIGAIKKIDKKYMFLVHTVSYLNFTWSLFLILFQFSLGNLILQSGTMILFILLQFYTNYSYYKMRTIFNTEKKDVLLKWRGYRQRVIGIAFYISLVNVFSLFLIQLNLELPLLMLVLSITIHILMVIDKGLLKFVGKISNYLVIFSFIFILGFSLLYFISWISLFSIIIIPVIVLLLLFEFLYLFKMLEFWKFVELKKMKIKNTMVIIFYLDIITWPLYFLSYDLLYNLHLILFTSGLVLLFSIIDYSVKSIKEETRKKIISYSLVCFGIILSIDIFFILEYSIQSNLSLNSSISSFIFTIFIGILFRPFKRHRLISFVYWALVFLLITFIFYFSSTSNWSWSLIAIGILIYPFIFMLEELKELINNFVDYMRVFLTKLKNAIKSLYYTFINFLEANFKYIRIIICIALGVFSGVLFSDIVLGLLQSYHPYLLAVAVFGIFYGLIPSKRAKEPDEIFEEKMKRFITAWLGMTGFIFALILPYIRSVLYSIVLIFPPILGLGAISLIFIYRKEKREKISIKWRFYTTGISIALFIIWIVILLIWYFFEVRI
jgi:hypothetical protein